MKIELNLLQEPKLQFGSYFEHEDTKTGLSEYGPFGKNIPGLHPADINLGFIGTRDTISAAKEWIDECGNFIESENLKSIRTKVDNTGLFIEETENDSTLQRLEKILNRDFIGFNIDTEFSSHFVMNSRWDRIITPKEIEKILQIEDKADRIWKLVLLFEDHIKNLSEVSPTPKIIILALTDEMVNCADRVQIAGNYYLDFRRAIKANSMKWGIPIQLTKYSTLKGKRGELQEKATRAWNFCTALYYKAEGVPWRPANLEQDACYIGISFYVTQDRTEKLTIRSSLAQAFDYLGQGLVLRGDPFEWDEEKHGRHPHLTHTAARKLIYDTLKTYLSLNRIPPKRVVIHKTSEFWGEEHPTYNELDGFYEGIYDVFPHSETDLLSINQTGFRMFREGMYPPLRGMHVTLDQDHHYLYTMGYIPYLETYPGSYVPEPWKLTDHHGGSSPKDLFKEVLTLTKMNVNNCAFADGVPITLSFAKRIGEIMKHISPDEKVQPHYKFYM